MSALGVGEGLARWRLAAAGAEARMDTRPGDRIAEELAALRRVAVLVARGVPPEEVFAAVTAEVRRRVRDMPRAGYSPVLML